MTSDPSEVLTRPAPPPDETARYGDDPDHIVDIFLPDGSGPAPLVIFIHGGFWKAAYDRTHTRPLATALAVAGYAVACIEYRRVGQEGGGWPGTFDDVTAAVAEVPDIVADHIAVDDVILAGHSAGGHLALWAAATSTGPPPAGVLALAPVCDLVAAYTLDLGDGAVGNLLGGGPDDVPERYAVADPRALLPVGVPTALVHGVLDENVPVELSRDYAAAVPDEARLVELPDAEHFAVIDPESPEWPHVMLALAALRSP